MYGCIIRSYSFSIHHYHHRYLFSNLSFIGRSTITSKMSTMSSTANKFALSEKYKGLERNVWVEFIQLALEYKPLNLGQGLPDDLVPGYVTEELKNIAGEPDPNSPLHQYTRGFGHPRLVNAIANLYSEFGGRTLNPNEEVLVTDGAYEALFCAISGHVNPGDEVIIIEPFFDCYEPMVKLSGGIPRFVSLKPLRGNGSSTKDWGLDPTELKSMFNSKTKAIIFNNPNNPLGKVFSLQEIREIADLCIEHDVLCISDEVYEHMVFDDSKMIRIGSLSDMVDRTITVGSAGKTFSVTGWKLGWAYGPKFLIKNCQIAHQNCVYACPTPIQEAVARSFEKELARLDSEDCYFKTIAVDLQKKRDFMIQALEEVGMTPVVPEGGYFIMANWKEFGKKADLSEEKDEYEDYRFVKWLSKTHKLQGIPPSAFFSKEHKSVGESYIRFCFIKKQDTLNKARDILKALK